MKRQKKEERLQSAVSKYIKLQYPDVVFTSESSGLRVGMGLAVQMKAQRSRHKLPDMIILQPNQNYKGLMLELKKDRNEIYTKKGELRQNEHITEQKKTLDLLNSKGYLALFACGIDEAKTIIDKYLKN